MLQTRESCLNPSIDANGNNNLTIVAAVLDTVSDPSVNLILTLKIPRSGLPVPGLQTASVSMVQQSTVGPYTLYSASYALNPSQSQNTKFAVSIGSGSSGVADGFKNTGDLPSTYVVLADVVLADIVLLKDILFLKDNFLHEGILLIGIVLFRLRYRLCVFNFRIEYGKECCGIQW
ncbi:hypothetical protein MMC12_003318 [Toensbergia leucococca]|nr:hypothetical protein [Toensbergia leucococca]